MWWGRRQPGLYRLSNVHATDFSASWVPMSHVLSRLHCAASVLQIANLPNATKNAHRLHSFICIVLHALAFVMSYNVSAMQGKTWLSHFVTQQHGNRFGFEFGNPHRCRLSVRAEPSCRSVRRCLPCPCVAYFQNKRDLITLGPVHASCPSGDLFKTNPVPSRCTPFTRIGIVCRRVHLWAGVGC